VSEFQQRQDFFMKRNKKTTSAASSIANVSPSNAGAGSSLG
jgi:hypothetical protein